MGNSASSGRWSEIVRRMVRSQIALAAVVVLALAGCPGPEYDVPLDSGSAIPSCTETVEGADGNDVEIATEFAKQNPDVCETGDASGTDADTGEDSGDSGDAGDAGDETSAADGSTDPGAPPSDQAAAATPGQAPTQQSASDTPVAQTPSQQSPTQQPTSQEPAGQTPTPAKPSSSSSSPTTKKATPTTKKATTTTTTMKPTTTTTMKPTTTTLMKVTIANSEWVMDLTPDPSSSGNSGKYNVRFRVDDGTVSGGQYESNLEATLVFSGTIDPDGSTKAFKANAGSNVNPTQKGVYYFDPATLKTPSNPKTIEGRYRHEIGKTTYTGSVIFTKRS